jgi:transposase
VRHELSDIKHFVRKLKRTAPGEIRACYEAGSCGYALQRTLISLGLDCVVIAPSLIPSKPGDRIKTDVRDASNLAHLFRAGLLTEVHPPTSGDESIRDLSRCREDAKEDLTRCRHRLSKMLLRKGYNWDGRNWTQAHSKWLDGLKFAHPADELVFQDYRLAITHLEERIQTLEKALEEALKGDRYREPVAVLRCFQGIDTISAGTIVAELHDFNRFHSARALMGYIGLGVSEDSSAERRRQGSITKTGNRHVRRILVESAWHYRHAPRPGKALRDRRSGQSPKVIAVADKAASRLHRKYTRMIARGKSPCKAVVAVARELAGFLWAALYPLTVKSA